MIYRGVREGMVPPHHRLRRRPHRIRPGRCPGLHGDHVLRLRAVLLLQAGILRRAADRRVHLEHHQRDRDHDRPQHRARHVEIM